MRELLRRIQMLLHRNRISAELDEEMRLHLELREQATVASGSSVSDAHRQTYLRFGNPTVIRERSLGAWGWSWLETLAQDIAYGFRCMLRAPVLTAVALLSLGLGIGANTAIFSFLDAIVLRSLPVKQPSQIMLLGEGRASGVTNSYGVTSLYSYPFFREFRQENTVFSDVASVFSIGSIPHGFVDHRDQMEPMVVDIVSGSFFRTLGAEPVVGRLLTMDDDSEEGAHPVTVLSYAWWQRTLAGDPNVLSHTIKLGDTTFNIIGVAPPGFFGIMVGHAPDMWVPLSMMKAVPPHWGGYKDDFFISNLVFGRLKPGVTPTQAEANVNLVYQQIIRSFPDAKLSEYNLDKLNKAHVKLTQMTTGLSFLRSDFSDPLKILMGVTAMVLLIACANIANLLLARSTVRAREFAVRQALGAGRIRLVRQLLTESLLLSLAGGALGVAFAVVANRFLLQMISASVGDDTLPLDVSLNYRLLLFSLAATAGTAVFFGIVPAFRATRVEITDALKDGRGASTGTARSPLGKVLVVAQVAISLVLAVAAILFLRNLVNLTRIDPGFARTGVMRLRIDPQVLGLDAKDPRMMAMFAEIEQRVSTVPGVQTTSFGEFFFTQGSWNESINVPGATYKDNVNVKHNVIGNGYFDTLQIPLLAGRAFGPQDTGTSHRVAIINESIARDLFPAGVNPIGHHYFLERETKRDVEVIGIVKDVKFGTLQEKQYIDYLPNPQYPQNFSELAVRYTGDFHSVSSDVQQAIHSVNRILPISHITTLDEEVMSTITNQRLVAQLSAFFGILAIFLSAIGIYGLMSYNVSRRTNEIGIRMALGAERAGVRWMVMREILLLVVIGVALGTVLSLAAGRLVANLLYGLKPTEPGNLGLAVIVLLTIALLAGYLPARRASQVSPMDALRYE